MRKHRVILGILVVTAVLLAGVLVVYAFGTPQGSVTPGGSATDVVASAGPDAAQVGGGAGSGASTAATGGVPAPDPGSPLAIEIPGCVCHSDDPELVEQHSQYRMNQCFGCHAGGMPEMGQ